LPPAETVTVPGFVGWRYCMWLPTVRSSTHPSACNRLMTSRYVMTQILPFDSGDL
jgi:hypothetical protein